MIGEELFFSTQGIKSYNQVKSVPPNFVLEWLFIRTLKSNQPQYIQNPITNPSYNKSIIKGWNKVLINKTQLGYILSKSNTYKVFREIRRKTLDSGTKEKQTLLVKAPMLNLNNPEIHIHHLGNDLFVLHGNFDAAELKKHPEIEKVTKMPKIFLHNKNTAGYLQTGEHLGSLLNGSYTIPREYNDLGLDGKGQVINVVDSGLDIHHPFFADENEKVPFENSSVIKPNMRHRKVVAYINSSDDHDIIYGHGTHVSGTAAGSPVCKDCGINKYSGVAPEAKLFFVDVGGEDPRLLDLNYNPYEIGLHMNKEMNCFISSNSWSTEELTPLLTDFFDQIAYLNPETLYIFAAGNEMEEQTVFAPSDSKNVLTVGATLMPTASFNTVDAFTIVKLRKDNTTIIVNCTNILSFIIGELSEQPEDFQNLEIVAIENAEAISEEVRGKFVIIKNNENINKTINMTANYGAKATMYISEKELNTTKVIIPVLYSTNSVVEEVLAMGKVSIDRDVIGDYGYPSLAFFSSYGPTFRAAQKPDITAPGYNVLSAAGGDYKSKERPTNYEAITIMSGTSMATPAIAGTAALIRQFFVDGWYEKLQKPSQNSNKPSEFSIKPSAALMKALLMHSARYGPNATVTDQSDNYGYGTPSLKRLFPIDRSDKVGIRVVDQVEIQPRERQAYTISVTNPNEDLVVTMAYTDAYTKQIYQALVTDLDLIIERNGNFYESISSLNNYERVVVKNAEPGVYKITVSSHNSDLGANYSLVITGGFPHCDDQNPLKMKPVKDKKCGLCNGDCIEGFCNCSRLQLGPHCLTLERVYSYGEDISFTLKNGQTLYFAVTMPNDVSKMKLHFTEKRKSNSSYIFTLSDSPFTSVNDVGTFHISVKHGGAVEIDNTETHTLYVGVSGALSSGKQAAAFMVNKVTEPTDNSDSQLLEKSIVIFFGCVSLLVAGVFCVLTFWPSKIRRNDVEDALEGTNEASNDNEIAL